MISRIKRCGICRMYTLKDKCPKCREPTENTFPPRYSPVDKYGKYRRMAMGLEGSDGDQ